eukprot:s2459_g11.t1
MQSLCAHWPLSCRGAFAGASEADEDPELADEELLLSLSLDGWSPAWLQCSDSESSITSTLTVEGPPTSTGPGALRWGSLAAKYKARAASGRKVPSAIA